MGWMNGSVWVTQLLKADWKPSRQKPALLDEKNFRKQVNTLGRNSSYHHLFWLLSLGAWTEALVGQGHQEKPEEAAKGQPPPPVWSTAAQGTVS